MAFDYKLRTYRSPLSSTAEQLLDSIDNFTGFNLFTPKDLHDTLDVFLDELDPKECIVSRQELEAELAVLNMELRHLPGKNPNDEKLAARREEIVGSVSEIKRVLSGSTGESIAVKVDRLGYYKENGRNQRPEISLNMRILQNDDELLAIVYVHELMHAYFDQQVMSHNVIPEIEEPLAEYGMLSFMDLFMSVPNLFNKAYTHVYGKKSSVGVKHYGFGAYLIHDGSVVYDKWLPEYKKKCVPTLNSPYLTHYKDLFKGAAYPRDEKSCKDLLKAIIFSLPYDIFAEYFSAISIPTSSRSRGNLRVDTGTKTIKLPISASTFADALREAADVKGVAAVMACNRNWCKLPLLVSGPAPVASVASGGKKSQRWYECKSSGGTFSVNTYSSDKDKKLLLEEIFKKLGLPWSVYID